LRKGDTDIQSSSSEQHRKIDIKATFACLGSLTFWSLGPIFIKYFTEYLDSWTQNMLRYSVASLFWLPFLLFSIKTKRLDRRIWRRALIPSLANVMMQSLWAAAFYYVGPAFMVLLTKTNIFWIAGFSFILFPEERTLIKSKRFWAGLILAAVGLVGVMVYKMDVVEAKTIRGIIIALAAAFMWGVYTVTVKMAFREIDSRQGFSVLSIYTVVGLSLCALVFGKPGDCIHLSGAIWAYIVVSGITAIAFAHTLYYAAIRRIGATIPALVILAQPFVVLGISNVVFGESLSGIQLLCGLLLLTGAALAIWAQQDLKKID